MMEDWIVKDRLEFWVLFLRLYSKDGKYGVQIYAGDLGLGRD